MQRKAKPDIYTILLGIALLAMLISGILIYLAIQEFGPNPTSRVPRVVRAEGRPSAPIVYVVRPSEYDTLPMISGDYMRA